MADVIEIGRPGIPNLEQSVAEILMDTKASIEGKQKISVPIAQIAGLGAGVASLIPAFRTVTQTTTMHLDGVYKVANAAVGDSLKLAKNGNFWPSLKESGKLAQLQAVESAPVTTQNVMAINPATIMIAVALFSIEQKLGTVVELEKRVLSFLEVEKATGKLIEKIPVVREASVDEFLQGSGDELQHRSDDLKKKATQAFAEIRDPGVRIFTEQMDELIQIYGHTQEIYFDHNYIHLVAG